MMDMGLSLSFLGAQKQNKRRWQWALIRCCLLWVHKTKQNKTNDECGFVIVFFRCTKTKQDDNECWLVVVFFGSIETKQKKMTTSVDWSLSSLGAHKQNEKRKQWALVHHCFLLMHINKTKKMTTSIGVHHHHLRLMEKKKPRRKMYLHSSKYD
jgi:hypothetical protein